MQGFGDGDACRRNQVASLVPSIGGLDLSARTSRQGLASSPWGRSPTCMRHSSAGREVRLSSRLKLSGWLAAGEAGLAARRGVGLGVDGGGKERGRLKAAARRTGRSARSHGSEGSRTALRLASDDRAFLLRMTKSGSYLRRDRRVDCRASDPFAEPCNSIRSIECADQRSRVAPRTHTR